MNRLARVVFLVVATLGVAHAQSVERQLDVANHHLEESRFGEAERAYRGLLATHPALIEAHDGLATALERQGRRLEAMRRLLEVGQDLVRSGDPEAGVLFLERAVGLDPELASARAALGHAFLQSQHYRDAETQLLRAIELGETSPRARLFLAAALWELGAYDEAETVYGKLLDLAGPSATAARRSLGALRVFRGDYAAAIPLLGAALGADADSIQLRYDLARALEGAKRTTEAIELYVTVIEGAPDFLQAHYRLARLYRLAGESGRAARHFDRFTVLHAEHQANTRAGGRLTAQLNQGWSQYRRGDVAAAVATIERLLETEPERLDLRRLLDEWRLEVANR